METKWDKRKRYYTDHYEIHVHYTNGDIEFMDTVGTIEEAKPCAKAFFEGIEKGWNECIRVCAIPMTNVWKWCPAHWYTGDDGERYHVPGDWVEQELIPTGTETVAFNRASWGPKSF